MYAVMWSEHCSYKSSRTYLGRFPTEAPWVLVGPGEGAGVIDIGDGLAVAVRIESHNHPSAVEPYQGAATGVGGIIRDIFSMGARPIALMDPLRFGTLDDARTRYLFEGVVSGISGYGNSVGVPTVGGEVVFDDTYRDNPLVNVLCLGILPDRAAGARPRRRGRQPRRAARLGHRPRRHRRRERARVRRASKKAARRSARRCRSAIPFEEKRLIEACLELLDRKLAIGVQDLGAAGLSCAASETAAKGGVGMDVDVARVAKREPGMNAVEVLTSESQERMLAIVEPAHLEAVLELARRWEVRGDGRRSRHRHRPLPRVRRLVRRDRRARREPAATARRRRRRPSAPTASRSPTCPSAASATGLRTAARLRARPPRTSCQADDPAAQAARRSSRAGADLGPGAARAARHADDRRQDVGVAPVRPPAVPQHRRRPRRRRRGAAGEGHAEGARARDRRQGALLPARPAHRRPARRAGSGAQRRDCTGARPLALVNCLNFGNPEHPEVMWQFSEVVEGISEACEALGIPVVGGNVSLLQRVPRRRHPSDPGRRCDRADRRPAGRAAPAAPCPAATRSSCSAPRDPSSVAPNGPRCCTARRAACRRWPTSRPRAGCTSSSPRSSSTARSRACTTSATAGSRSRWPRWRSRAGSGSRWTSRTDGLHGGGGVLLRVDVACRARRPGRPRRRGPRSRGRRGCAGQGRSATRGATA